MSKIINEYYEAFERLKKNKPINIPTGSPINNDTVALEAGRKRGSIKKSRPIFYDLIQNIEVFNTKINQPKQKLLETKEEVSKYKTLYENALGRELMYLERINELEKLLKEHY